LEERLKNLGAGKLYKKAHRIREQAMNRPEIKAYFTRI